jgi:predicted nucleic acid-binding protein
MELVVDANVLFSALLRDGKTREFMLSDELTLFAPEFVVDEFIEHLGELTEKTCIASGVLKRLVDELFKLSNIKVLPLQEFS